MISAHTQARGEGYFRLEWTIAEERAQHFARGVPFIVPVVIDDTAEAGAAVPEAFLRVQWTRLPLGVPSPQFVERLQRLLGRAEQPPAPGGPAPGAATAPPSRLRSLPRLALLAGALALAAAAAWWRLGPERAAVELPVVVLMDSTHPERVYDDATRASGGSNADDLTDVLRGLPIRIIKDGTNSQWNRETEVVKENPALIVIHRSAFVTSTEKEMIELMNNKLIAFFGYIATRNPRTHFIVYSRGSWEDALFAAKWREDAANRFPVLAGRIETWRVPLDRATFRHPVTAQEIKDSVVKQLGLKAAPRD
jgi:hypothetical protein